MGSIEQYKQIWCNADVVCFDVDSTVIKDEGLDELAEFCGVGKQVKEWTNKAMGGSMRFRTALEKRLDIIQPTMDQVTKFRETQSIRFSDGLEELVKLLHERGTKVYLVSGGFRSIIEPAAKLLHIPYTNIFANRLKFFYNGDYAGFDTGEPTSDSGGKKLVAEKLKQTSKNLVFIGDGATDLEAYPPADLFIGYGGNVQREKVKQNAPWFVTDFQDLIQPLQGSR
ncbi:phosphoserine phosphatase-like [Ruditapes philippinarum]|uniref:phosphoserine phosphatase-like n=1 Tax=Ruditapes philippinarum TaxID=129788 RepID=UPI00295A79FA|nr:phosphoserine phosphatase-like [Ruditapes philippinarum]